jgi:YHS domain-containing protein
VLTRILLVGLFLFFLARAVWRLFAGIVAGAQIGSSAVAPQRGERMVRDPVCGTFVLPSRALSLGTSAQIRYFCSEQCRAAYQRHPEGAADELRS